jgi:perosamine synthetase
MQPLRELARRRGLLVIEDCAHALFALDDEDRPVGDLADLAVFSLRKHLPVPDGGMMLVADRLAGELAPRPRSIPWRPALKSAIALAALELEHRWPVATDWLRRRSGAGPRVQQSDAHARDFPEGARFAPQSADWRMSRLARAMVARVDAAAVRARRLANFRLLAEALSGHAWVRPIWRDAPDGASPWIMPVLARAPSALCAYMLRHGVEAYRVWPHRHPAMPAATDVGAVTPIPSWLCPSSTA